ncbi:unnamed protein product, partial [Onchocerca ochengi]|uniref:DNA-directed RNA polymerase n=1 Tax=Onchocerca ochengi TaxID=42157 RepID=A0A182EWN5_ONCOC
RLVGAGQSMIGHAERGRVQLVFQKNNLPQDTKAQSQLYCYYKMDCPYLRLAPFKVESVRQNPLATLFYDIISDGEARIIQMLAVTKAYLMFFALHYSTAC